MALLTHGLNYRSACDEGKTVDLDYRLEVTQGHIGTNRQIMRDFNSNFRSNFNRFRYIADFVLRRETLLHFALAVPQLLFRLNFGVFPLEQIHDVGGCR